MSNYKFLSEKFERKFEAFRAQLNATDLTEELAVARVFLSEALDAFSDADKLVAASADQVRVRDYAKSCAELKIQAWLDKVTSIAERWDRMTRPVNGAINTMFNIQFPELIETTLAEGIAGGLDANQITHKITGLLANSQDASQNQTKILPSTDNMVRFMDETVPMGPVIDAVPTRVAV